MQIITDSSELQDLTESLRTEKKTIGFVPTMGALHEGHLNLVRAARQQSDIMIASIFVNPTQFGASEDLSRYPRNLERDTALLKPLGVDYLFLPTPAEIYPAGFTTYVTVEGLSEILEGASRPGHFRGVTTVLMVLFNLVRLDKVFMGQKDAQQTIVVKKMVHDLRLPVEIVVLPTTRETDGLAMSSRNQYLNPAQREAAIILFQALGNAQGLFAIGERSAQKILAAMKQVIASELQAQLEYIAINDAQNLAPLDDLEGRTALLSLAVRFGQTRLIDNIILP